MSDLKNKNLSDLRFFETLKLFYDSINKIYVESIDINVKAASETKKELEEILTADESE